MPKPMIQTGAPGDEQTYRVRQGGLMRCCLLTLARWHGEANREGDMLPSEEGDIMTCDFCSSSMIFIDEAWEWNKGKTDYTLRG